MKIKSNRDIRAIRKEVYGRLFAAEHAPSMTQTIAERLAIVASVYREYGEKLGKHILMRDSKPDLIQSFQMRIADLKWDLARRKDMLRLHRAAQKADTELKAWGVWNEWTRIYAKYMLSGGMPIAVQRMAEKYGILFALMSEKYEPISPEKLNAAFEG